MKKIVLYALFSGLIVVFLGLIVNSKESIEVSVDYGINEYFKMDTNGPFYISISNNGEDFEGFIELETGEKNTGTIYRQEMSFPKGTTREATFFIPVNIHLKEPVVIRVKNHQGEIITTTRYEINHQKVIENELAIGVLTDDPIASLNYFETTIALNESKRNTRLIEIDHTHLPVESVALESLDVLIINNYNTSILNNNQYDSMMEWVDNGGLLILGTGSSHNRTLSVFNDTDLPISIKGTQIITTDFNIHNFESIELESIKVVQEGFETVFDELITLIPRNDGQIILVAFDLEPLNHSEEKESFTNAFFSNQQDITPPDYILRTEHESIKNRLEGIFLIAPTAQMPSLYFLMFLLLVYAFLAGPITYKIVKKGNIRNWLWVIVPILSFVFVGVIYIYGKDTRISQPFINRVNFITLGEETGDVTSYISPISMKSQDLTLTFTNNDFPRMWHDTFTLYDGSVLEGISKNEGEKSVMTYEENNTIIHVKNINRFTPNIIETTEKVDASEQNLYVDIIYDGDYINGTITNELGYTIEDAFFWSKGLFANIGDIEEGVNEISEEVIVIIGSTTQHINEQLFPMELAISKDIKRYEKQTMRQRRDIIETMHFHKNFVPSNESRIIGFSNEKKDESDIEINNQIPIEHNVNVVIKNFDLDYNGGQVIQFPLQYFYPWVPLSSENPYASSLHDVRVLRNIKEQNIRFELDPAIEIIEIGFEIPTIEGQVFNPYEDFEGQVYIYNFGSEEYEAFDYKNETIKGGYLQEIIDDTHIFGEMNVKVITNQDTSSKDIVIPVIEVKGRRK
ncbi:hypothetical protein EDC19_1138 [Natranaerovirga hydrolytica]|uniref:Uncharacterized protein n=1 Tax=Natranaerovirga hydrolytica TaxID=680378 RepID=A0A4R1MZT2_9FIRM|nr:hypothetical protein [Natranaerovirga hydrolytica]TCK98705.1 hypothetical protein EDC19_1138 [Natranaerovirga hydrolytica]